MAGGLASRSSTLAIVMGASEYPLTDLDPLKPASNTARDLVAYLTSKEGLNLLRRNVLDLFDSDQSPADIDEKIAQFLKNRQEALRRDDLPAHDLIFYYIGHGGFTAGDQGYFLALRTTRKDHEGTSGLRMVDLAGTLAKSARDLRRFLILDCCYAGSADAFFQMSNPAETMRKQALDSLPRKGTALLCSSSASKVSLSPEKEQYTMFSGVLLDILRDGRPSSDEAFSLKQIGDEVRDGIEAKFGDKAVRPRVSSPDEREGDIADIPLFPNRSYRPTPQRERGRVPATHSEREWPRTQVASLLYKGVGIILSALPCVLAAGRILGGGYGIEPSISYYYYTNMRDVFVVGFCSIGLLSLTSLYYDRDAYDRKDQIVLILTCLFAFGVAFFPAPPAMAPTESQILTGMAHFFFMVFLFLTFSYSSLVQFTKTAFARPPNERKLQRNIVYRVCGWTIVASIVLIFVAADTPIAPHVQPLKPVFWLESLAMNAFGVASFVRGQVILRDPEIDVSG